MQKASNDGTQAKICLLIEEASGLDHLEALQNHSSHKIYEMAFSIVEKYFQGEVCSNSEGINISIFTYFNKN